MADYRIEPDADPAAELRRIATAQIDKAIAEAGGASVHTAVHDVRKRCKKIRGLLRLYRPLLENTYKAENAWFRDTARALSDLRDAQSLVATSQQLQELCADDHRRGSFRGLVARLTERREAEADTDPDARALLLESCRRFRKARERVAGWEPMCSSLEDLLPGLGKTYRRGRDARVQALRDQTPERFHSWRKRTKYHDYHLRLLAGLWPGLLRPWRAEVHRLSELLGDLHDLSVLARTVADAAPKSGLGDIDADIDEVLARRRAELRPAAMALGARVYAEKPRSLLIRLGGYARATNSWPAGGAIP